MTNIPALSTIATEKSSANENTERKVEQLLNYVAIHPDDKVQYHASGMILKIRSDASYLLETQARSRVVGYHFLGITPVKR